MPLPSIPSGRLSRVRTIVSRTIRSAMPIASAYRSLRHHLVGVLRFDEHVRPIRVIVAPDGRLVAPVMVAMIEAAETVLYLPDEGDDSLQVLVTLDPFDERGPHGALADRWCAYHGEPPDVRWAFMLIDAARYEGHFIDGIALAIENRLVADEPRLCRELNARTDLLQRMSKSAIDVELEKPVLVGVDQHGFDLRGAFDIFRVHLDEPIGSAGDVIPTAERLASGG